MTYETFWFIYMTCLAILTSALFAVCVACLVIIIVETIIEYINHKYKK